MGEIKISALTPAASVIGTDVIAGVESGTTKKVKAESILMTQSVDAVKWGCYRISPTASQAFGAKPPGYAPFKNDGAGSAGVYVYWFDSSLEEELFFDIQAPMRWKEGTKIYFQISWCPKTNGGAGEKVCWGLEDTVAERGAVFGNTTILYSDTHSPVETLVANKVYYSEIEVTNIDGKVDRCHLTRLFRDATGAGGVDSYTDDVALLQVGIKFEVDGLGASSRTTK